jgi:hypothetical protein
MFAVRYSCSRFYMVAAGVLGMATGVANAGKVQNVDVLHEVAHDVQEAAARSRTSCCAFCTTRSARQTQKAA